MKPVYNQNGIIKDWSDEGLEVDKVESRINYQLFIKKLTARQLELLELKIDGHSQKEIAIKLKVSQKTIKREMSAIERLYGIIILKG